MLKRLFLISTLSVFLFGCKKDERLEEYLFKSWTLHWKQCGLYYNRYNAQLTFTETDTTNFGIYSEQGYNDVTFDFTILSDQEVLIYNATDDQWDGVLNIHSFGNNRLEISRPKKGCENELFQFN